MWVLFVINVVTAEPGESAIKYTRYDEYNTELKCNIEKAVLEANFTLNEGAVCEYEKRLEK